MLININLQVKLKTRIMTKKIYLILIPIIIISFFTSCKNQGNPYISWRKTDSYIMRNINGGYCHLSAYKDSAYVIGINYAEIHGEHLKISDSIEKILTVGHCLSLNTELPTINLRFDTTDGQNLTANKAFINAFTEYNDYNNVTFTGDLDTIKLYQYISDFYNLEPDTTYYVRSYAIIKYNSGRTDTAYNQVTTAFRTKIREDMWIHKPDFNGDARTEAVSFVMNNKAYIATGYDGLSLMKDFWEYDPYSGPGNEGTWLPNPLNRGAWMQGASFNGDARMSAAAFVIKDTVYIGTGITDATNMTAARDMWKLNISGELPFIWKRVDSLFENSERYNAVAFSLTMLDGEQRGFIGLGEDDAKLGGFYYYQPDEDTSGAPPGAGWGYRDDFVDNPRSEAVVAVLNNRAIVGGGIDNDGVYRSDFYIFDPTTQFWSPMQICPAPARANAIAFALNFDDQQTGTQKNYFYFGTGRGNGGQLYNDLWRYDYSQSEWTECSIMHEFKDTADARQGAIGFSITKDQDHASYGPLQRGFVGLGKSSNGYKRDFWEYLP